MSYNGYPNWETYTVSLHLDQDLQGIVNEMMEEYDLDGKEQYEVTYDVAEHIKEWTWDYYHMTATQEFEKTIFHDMIHGCMTTCDWTFLAKHFLAEVDEYTAE
jgi:hypothetical protein